MKIDVSDLPGNSNMEKAANVREARRNEDDVTPKNAIVKGHIKKRSSAERISEVFIAQDLKTVAGVVFERVIIPNLRRLAVDTIDSIARGVFMGDDSVGASRGERNPLRNTSYYSYYENNSGAKATTASHKTPGQYRFAELIFDSYGEAQLVIDKMDECLEDCGVVTIADMYGFADVTCPYTGNYYGWTNIASAKIVADSDGYWIKMPKAKPIKD